MRAAAAIAAGSTFAGAALGGLLLGIVLDRALHQSFYAAAGLFAGLLFGGYAAFRLLSQALAP